MVWIPWLAISFKEATKILKNQLDYITQENLSFLKNLDKSFKYKFGEKQLYCVHGGLEDAIDEYVYNPDLSYFENNNFKEDILISGHTHVPKIEKINNQYYLNPGSIGQPRDKNQQASYLILDGDQYYHRRVSYPINIMENEMKKIDIEHNIKEELIRRLKSGEWDSKFFMPYLWSWKQ